MITYDNFSLDDLGDVTLKQSREFEDGDAPQRAKVTLKVGVEVFERDYASNYALIQRLRAALATPNAVLVWSNGDTGEEYINQTVTSVADDLPEEWGTYHQVFNLTFVYYEALDTALQNLPLTFSKTGSGVTLSFGNVRKWTERTSLTRFSTLLKQRKETRATVAVEGLILGDTTLPLETRRATLAGLLVKFRANLNAADGQLTFGTGDQQMFNGPVRIEEFTAEVDHAICAIPFAFTASYTLFPNLADYALAELDVEEKDNFTGETMLNVAGKIQSDSEAHARTKLAATLAAVLAQYGYAKGQQLELDTAAHSVDADADGVAFVELTFTGVWRKWRATNQLATFQKTGGTGPVGFGNVTKWKDGYKAERFDPRHSVRKLAIGSVAASGTIAGDPTMSLADRRAAMLVMQRALKAEVNSADGTLKFGDWTQVVKVEEFEAEINQAETGVDWSLTASYVIEPGGATAEFTAAEKDNFTGETILDCAGKISALDEATARAKLAAILPVVLAQYHYDKASQQLAFDTNAATVDGDGDGQAFTELTFTASWRKWKLTNQAATFQKTGGTTAGVPFGNVTKWKDGYKAERFDLRHNVRKLATGSVAAAGTWAADPAMKLADRRAQLLRMQRALKAEVNSADGTLKFGDWTQVVKVEEFEAEINQAETGVDWSLTASYVIFPGGATAEFSAAEKDNFTGETVLDCAGKITAADEATARAKLAAILPVVLQQYGYTKGQQLALDTTPTTVDGDTDGQAFTELTFTVSWRKWRASNQLATFQRTATGSATTEPVGFGNVTKWKDGYKAERFDPRHNVRKLAIGSVMASGTIAGDPTMSLADRRAAMLVMQRALKAEVNSADGTLKFGDWTQVVKVEEFEAEINQAETGVDWSLTASYVIEPGGATAEFTAAEKDNFTGETILDCAGKISAPDEATARAKLAAILPVVLKQYGYTKGQQLTLDTTPTTVDGDTDGQAFTELTFTASWRKWRVTNQLATFKRTGGTAAVPFGNVAKWKDGYKAERFDPRHNVRKLATGSVTASGTLAGDPTLALKDRRAALLKMQRALKAEVSSADGTLTYGDWSQVVKVEEFDAEINQAETGVDWSLTVSFLIFPNGATAEFTAAEKDNFTGETVLDCAGKISAPDEATARAKLAALLPVLLAQYGYAKAAQQLALDTTPTTVDGDTDGQAFTELSFTASWRKWRPTNQLATFQSGTEPVTFGNVTKWKDGYKAERFDPLHPQRKLATATVTASGTLAGDPALSLADRRAQLLRMQRALKAEVNAAAGTLTYGDWKQVVRVESFEAEVNQAETGVDWSLAVNYVLFPNASGFATAEIEAAQKDGMTGETFFTLTGKIQAFTEAAARTKLTASIATFLAQYGYNNGKTGTVQQLDLDTTPSFNDADADGLVFGELAFTGQWRLWRASNQAATFQKTGGTQPVSLGNVRTWEGGYKAQRFDDERSERRHATGTVSASGTWSVDPTMALADRRAALLKQQRALASEVNSADGTLVFGDWTQVVRVEELIAHINQAETGIDWAFSASYSIFPNEGGYLTCSFTAEVRDDTESGDSYLVFAGEILAPNASLARAKLALLRAGVLKIYGYDATQRTRGGSTVAVIDANGDKSAGIPEGIETQGDLAGASFLRLPFSEEYRRRTPGSVVSSTFNIASRDDTASGLVLTTFAGSVTATGPTTDAAIAAAIVQAMVLGANKEPTIDATAFLKMSSLDIGKRQLTLNSSVELVRVAFAYEYQSKLAAGRAYLEMNSAVSLDTFGTDGESVSGFVVARDFATANAMYQAQVRAAYAGRLIRGETLTQNSVIAQSGPGYKTQQLKFDFAFSAFRPKAAGSVGARYSLSISRDLLQLAKKSRVSGSVFALNYAAADAFVNTLMSTFGLGSNTRSDRTGDHETDGVTDAFTKLDFTEEFESALTGVAGILECRLSESVTYSSTRYAVQDLPFNANGGGGFSIPQPAGVTPGARSVRGTVSSASLATAEAWAWSQRALLTGDASGGFWPTQPQLERDYEFVPRTDGIPTGDSENVRIFRVSFTFAEILPNYPAPG